MNSSWVFTDLPATVSDLSAQRFSNPPPLPAPILVGAN